MNKKLTKLTFILITAFTSMVSLVTQVQAQQIENPVIFDDITDIIGVVMNLVRLVVVLIFIAMLMYGGFTYLTAGASEEKVAEAKKIIVAAIVGFIIVALAPAIVQLVGRAIGVDGGLL